MWMNRIRQEIEHMSFSARSRVVKWSVCCALWLGGAAVALALPPRMPPSSSASSPSSMPAMGGGSSVSSGGVKIKSLKPVKETTPAFEVKHGGSSTIAKTWWCARTEFETDAEWTDELEFTTYVYVEKSAKHPEVMYRNTVTYVNLAKGRHLSDVFLHPDTLSRVGVPKYVAVVVKAGGRVIASESSASTPNWWDRFSPVDGVLLHRGQTPFAVIDFDSYPCIKPSAGAR
jgi:hypothetical protein